jgi:hypothetical protein
VSWQGLLLGTFHATVNNIRPTVHRLTATNPEICTIHYNHPHLHRGAPRQIAVKGHPPEVYEWICNFDKVSIPSTLRAQVTGATDGIKDALSWLAGDGEKIDKCWRIDPWYFFEVPGTQLLFSQTKDRNLKIKATDVVIFSQLFNPEGFKFLDHQKVYETLTHLEPRVLSKLWLAKPDYFSILSVTDPKGWETLHEKAVEGLCE